MRLTLSLCKKKKIAVQAAVLPCAVLGGVGVLRATKSSFYGQKTR